MQAIILAAGMGKRLGELTAHNTKCMIKVNGMTLIERVLRQLDRLDLKRIVIVIGYEGKRLADLIGSIELDTDIEFVTNPIYEKTNNIYSLYLARDFLQEDDTLLLESDLIFEDAVLDKLVKDPYPCLALVARFENWMDGTAVTIDENRNITRFIDKSHFSYNDIMSYYKTVNIYKFSKEFLKSHYVPFLEAYCKALGNNEYYEQVLRIISLIDKSALKALPLTSGELWYEIDDIQDLDIAESIFCEDSINKISKRFGGYWRYPGILDFCYLVNPYFPNRKMLDEIQNNFSKLISCYPSGRKVNNLLAAMNFNIRESFISVGNGAAELIKCLMDKVLRGKTGFVLPTFEEYPNRNEKENTVVFIPDNRDFAYTAEDLKEYFGDKGISSLVIVNPDNPSGNFISRHDILGLCRWAAGKNIRLIIDESFVDFSDDFKNSTLLDNDTLSDNPNLIVIKSISKSFGVAGLRLGIIASSDKSVIGTVNKELPIWNINSFAEFFMQIFRKYENEYTEACIRLAEERKRFKRRLDEFGFIRAIPSQANYFLCEILEGSGLTSETIMKDLFRYNILIKDCSAKKGFQGRSYIRIAIRDSTDNDKLIDTLKILYNK